MATVLADSLKDAFGRLQAERERSWSSAQLAANAGQRRTLQARFDPAAVARTGDVLPDFALADVEGGALTLSRLTAGGPAVLVFFRFAGCPACNIALSHYDRTLAPELQVRGVPLVAVSPQVPGPLRAIRERHQLSFAVASDPDNGLARHIGITFVPDGSSALPPPGVLVIEPGLRVRHLQVSPDWLDRPEAADILALLDD